MPTTQTSPAERAAVEALPARLLIDGRWRDAEGGGTFEVEDPALGEPIGRVADATGADAQMALEAAERAPARWARTPPRERADILHRAFEEEAARADELALVMTLEMGKPLARSREEASYAAEYLRWFSEEAARIEGAFQVAPDGERRTLVMRQPVGRRWPSCPGAGRS